MSHGQEAGGRKEQETTVKLAGWQCAQVKVEHDSFLA